MSEQQELRKQAALEAAAAAEAAAAGVPLPPPCPPPVEPPPEEPPIVPPAEEEIRKIEKQVQETGGLDVFTLVLNSARVEDLGIEQQEFYRKVEARGIGICSKCRFRSGCLNCDVEKAWRYVVRWELGQRAVDRVPGVEGAGPKPAGGGETIEVSSS